MDLAMPGRETTGCSQNTRNSCDDEGFPNENVALAPSRSRSETLSTDVLGLPSPIANFLASAPVGTQFMLELKEIEGGGRSVQIRKQGNKKRKLIANNQESVRCSGCTNCSSQNVASNDHILKRILHYLDVPTLLQCRLVSHRFKEFAGSLLRNRIQLEFVDLHLNHPESGKLLSELTALLQNEHMDLPCNNIQFIEVKEYFDWEDQTLLDFFDIFGSRIETLNFLSRLIPESRGQERKRRDRDQEEWVQGIKQLLFYQTRNLQTLNIQISFPRNEEPKRSYLPESGLFFIKTDEGFREVEEESNTFLHEGLHLNLRLVRMGGTYDGVPLKLLETILQRSPNLQEVLFDHNNYMPFVQPMNRLHLFKTLEFKFWDPDCLKAVNKVLDFVQDYDLHSSPRLFQLRHLKLFFDGPSCELGRTSSAEFISAFTRLLTYTGDSLESFSWTVDGTVNLQEIKFSSVLPSVKKLILKSSQNTYESSGGLFFPPGLILAEMFPNLQELVLFQCGPYGGMAELTERLDFESHFQRDLKMRTVRRVKVKDCTRQTKDPQIFRLTSALLKIWFPNAYFTYEVSGMNNVQQAMPCCPCSVPQ